MDTAVFIILIFPLSVLSQTFIESGPGIVKPSQEFRMSCKVSGLELSDYTVDLVRQLTGGKLEWIGVIWGGGSTDYADPLTNRISISKDNAKKEVYLQINTAETKDSGTYYCVKRMGSGNYFDVWGQGTYITVTSAEIVSPQVFPLITIGQEENSIITMACLARNYYPEPLTVVWNTTSGDTLSGEKNIPFTLSGDPPSYSMVSQMTVSSSEWKSNHFSCDVSHYSFSIQKNIPRGCTPLPKSPTVYILQGSCFNQSNDKVDLSCQAYNLTSKDATIKWFINEEERALPQELLHLGNSSNNFYAVHSRVSIFQGEWNNGARVKCQVIDANTGNSSEATARKCSEINCLGIKVFMLPPTIEDLYVHRTARIACIAYDLKQATGYTFRFDYPGAPDTLDVQIEDPHLHPNGTYSLIAFLTVSPETWQSNIEFTGIVLVTGLADPIIRTISMKIEEKLIVPRVAIFPPTPEDIAKDELCLITCIAYGFYPAEVYMGWTKNDDEISKEQHVNSEPKRNNRNPNFSASSFLSVPCSEWKEGNNYGCTVGHKAIPLIFIRRVIDKHAGKPTTVNVSIAMSDTTMSCY